MNNDSSDSSFKAAIDSPYERLIGYTVTGSNGEKIGHVDHVYVESDGQPLFVGIKTGWIFGRHYIVPVSSAEVNDGQSVVRLPFTEALLKDAPNFEEDSVLTDSDHVRLFSYYGITSAKNSDIPQKEDVAESRNIKLKEEELKVGKRQVEAGGVRLHKIVRTETVNQPVELQREEIVIERVPGSGAAADETFEEEDIFIPLRREELVVEKTARVREQVRVGKKTEVDRQNVTGEVRKEDVQIDKTDRSSS